MASKWNCVYCGRNTQLEHFYLKDEIWYKIWPNKKGMVCISCSEIKIGRPLQPTDFTEAFINRPDYGSKTMLLLQRMGYD